MVGQGLGPTLDRSRDLGSVALTAGYLHLVLLAGVLATAVGHELILSNVGGPNGEGALPREAGAGR
jgi:hypothetical protein